MTGHRACALGTVLFVGPAIGGCGDAQETGSLPTPTYRPAKPAPVREVSVGSSREGYLGARVLARTGLRASPGGRVVTRIGTRTEYGLQRVLAVARRKGDWIGVITPHRPNGHLGWVPARRVQLVREPVSLHVALSKRRLRVKRSGRVVMTMPIAVGGPATPTPTGRFGVTDVLRPKGATPYGCCIVALSAHQPRIAQGWTGGDRIAIHATTNPASVGQPVSLGCMRAHEADMRRLMRLVPLGAPVFVRA